MGLFSRFTEGLTKSRESLREDINLLLNRGPKVDEEFWEGLEETLILSDMGGYSAVSIVDKLRNESVRKGYRDAYDVLDALNETIANEFVEGGEEILGSDGIVLFVGVNGSGKTIRAAAIEQLEVWAKRADVEIVSRERGSDPASVCYETIERGEQIGADLVLIDTAGRLHTSSDLMRELEKVVSVVRKRANLPVKLVLVIDATTGQNGLQQAREFNSALDLDGVIITKLDGTAKGGIAVAVAHYLNLPIVKLGVGEGLEDLKDFDAHEYAAGLVGDFGRE